MKKQLQMLCRGCVAALLLHAHQLAAREPDEALPLRGELLMQLSAELEDPQQVGEAVQVRQEVLPGHQAAPEAGGQAGDSGTLAAPAGAVAVRAAPGPELGRRVQGAARQRFQ